MSQNYVNVLITGFEPFGPYKYNPVEDVANFFDWKNIDRLKIKWIVLSSIYNAFAEIKKYINEESPSIILGMWLASRVNGIRIETVGNNIRNSDYADANWMLVHESLIENKWPSKIKLNIDEKKLYDLLKNENIPVEISNDAEWFICNDIIYQTARYIEKNKLNIKHCFIHTPWTTDYLDKVAIEDWKMKIEKETLIKAINISLKWMYDQIVGLSI